MKYQITYEATYYVDAESEAEAEEKGMSRHENNPDGTWTVWLDPYASPLEQLPDGTYAITSGDRSPVRVHMLDGYWVAVEAVQAVSDVPAGQYLGIWTDDSTGKRYYDRSVYVSNLADAMKLAREHDQLSIWDNANNEAIPVLG